MKTILAVIALGLTMLASLPAFGEFPIRKSNNSDIDQVVVYNATNNEYLVVWNEYIPLGPNLYLIGPVMGQRFAANGTKLGAPFQIFNQAAYPSVTYNSKTNEYLVVVRWTGGIHGQRLSNTGAKVGSSVLLMSNSDFPRVLYNDLANEYFLAAYHYATPHNTIYVRRISTNLQSLYPNKDLLVSDSTFCLTYAPIAPKGRYLLSTWPEGHDLLDWQGNLIKSIKLETGYPTGGYADGEGYSGSSADYVQSAFGYKDGKPVFMVVWDDMNNIWPWPQVPGVSALLCGVWGAYIDAVNPPGQVTNTFFPITDIQLERWCYARWKPKVVYNKIAQKFIVAWNETPTNKATNDATVNHIRATTEFKNVVGFSNVVLSATNGNENPDYPVIATSSSSASALVVWQDKRNLSSTDIDLYGNIFAATQAHSITLDVPNGGESWEAGTPRIIVWRNQNFSDPVKIEYSKDGGQTFSTIVASTANTGSYTWNVPNTPSTQCRVRISDAADGDPFDVSNSDFAITATESITLDVPNGGENWVVGTPHFIVWHNHLYSGPVKIEYSTNGGADYTTIAASAPNTGSYQWTIPNTPSTNCLVKISDPTDGNPWDVSDNPFTISTTTGNNTQPGTNVQVNLGSGVVATFDNVAAAGNTTLNSKTSGSAPPGGFAILPIGTPIYYDISTTATYTGNIQICIQYNDAGMTSAQEAALKLHVDESPPGQWKDITSSLDVNANIICGTVTHLSDFAVMMPIAAESITVISPNGGENWPVGSQQEIKWSSANIAGKVSVEYSTDGGNSFSPITFSTDNDGAYLWTVPSAPSASCRVKMSVALGGALSDTSDADFAIVAGHTPGVIIVDNTDDSGAGSLRVALLQANAAFGPDTIRFNIPKNVPGYDADSGVWTILPQSDLPIITDGNLVIDGFSQKENIGEDSNPNGPEIQIDGSSAGDANGLIVKAPGVEIYGLTINRFSTQAGILMDSVEGGRISGCYLGTNFAGNDAASNQHGIKLVASNGVQIASMDTIFNLISGNSINGIGIYDSCSHNAVIGNIIGLDRTASHYIANNYGIGFFNRSDSNEVFDNYIGGNTTGIYIGESNANVVANNFIGTDETQEAELSNGTGIYIFSNSKEAQHNFIAENLIGYSAGNGVSLSGNLAIYNTITHNSIFRNAGRGILNVNGGNMELVPPVLHSVSDERITGAAGQGQIIEIFADENDEGMVFIGEAVADDGGDFSLQLSGPLPPLPHVSATARDADGNTSQFCPPFDIITAVDERNTQIPEEFTLNQNYPNPFNPETMIHYTLPKTSFVILQIVNLRGEIVITLVHEQKNSGLYSVKWDGSDRNGNQVASGIYLYRFQAGNFVAVKKMLFIK